MSDVRPLQGFLPEHALAITVTYRLENFVVQTLLHVPTLAHQRELLIHD
jgi:hypothetical protein